MLDSPLLALLVDIFFHFDDILHLDVEHCPDLSKLEARECRQIRQKRLQGKAKAAIKRRSRLQVFNVMSLLPGANPSIDESEELWSSRIGKV
ncbi:unnamed protein product [Angiostrongylus costaricensis]|uniref:Uncharacterized protein n=1 Tax=Angiostrongylus costaricensis TaxID=334426 RepID=A0A0R3PHT0_ANGCS|nr:unnamed protein product [Angiostrongylus costaricensis]